MNIFGSLFGGVLKGLDVEDVLKRILTNSTAAAAKGPFTALYQKMKVEGRRTLAGRLRKAADHLERGECAAAAEVTADVIESIKF